ncbi:recombinase family protein [Sphingomonas sp. RB3P16]|uniref:recombinase family protein n=1 Tax=Parasphingomonas frigoris TaxID=3096163 RepID=UPI002FC91338
MFIVYARVSTADQDLALQTDALNKARCEKLFTDKASGAKADRPGLVEALRFARAGDCIVVWKLDRLGRSIQGLITLAADLSARSRAPYSCAAAAAVWSRSSLGTTIIVAGRYRLDDRPTDAARRPRDDGIATGQVERRYATQFRSHGAA